MNFSSILNQIAENKIEEALEGFDAFFKSTEEFKEELVLIKRRIQEFKKTERLGVLENDKLSVEKSRISKSIVDVYSSIVALIEEHSSEDVSSTRQETIEDIVQNAISDKGFQLDYQILADQSSYYFKAKKQSFVQKDFYVIQVLNWYKLANSQSVYNQEYLNFFSKSSYPFVDLVEFFPGSPSYLIRKYAPGLDLNIFIESGLKLSLLRALDSIIIISKGLVELDKSKIFYNNLIPDQIILDSNCQDLQLLPLNIFEENASVVTWKNLKDGIKYMSPEQLKLAGNKLAQNNLTIQSNQFSLGLILFYMLMGESLFDGKGLPSLYEDRVDKEDTKAQLKGFFKTVKSKLLQFGIEEATASKLKDDFKIIFKKLIEPDPSKRHEKFEDFISDLEFLKLHIEKEKKQFNGDNLYAISGAFESAILHTENFIEDFYNDLINELPAKKSMEEKNRRDLRFRFSMDYLFTSLSNLENEDFLKDALSCLVKSLHVDFTIEDYEVYFKVLGTNIQKSDPDWSSGTEEAWKVFSNNCLDAIDSIFNPQ